MKERVACTTPEALLSVKSAMVPSAEDVVAEREARGTGLCELERAALQALATSSDAGRIMQLHEELLASCSLRTFTGPCNYCVVPNGFRCS